MRKEVDVKICCLSDLHGYLPEVPDCQLLVLSGDYCPMRKSVDQQWWLRDEFGPWLTSVADRGIKVIGVAGNHDFIFQERPDLVPKLDWVYLQDSGIVFNGLNVYGSPWQLRFYNWAFNADEEELAGKWENIPDDTDILLLHGPPRGFGDFSSYGHSHTGSPSLLTRIEQIRPKLVVAGHIHSGHGVYHIPDRTIFVNAAYVDECYLPNGLSPIVIDLKC